MIALSAARALLLAAVAALALSLALGAGEARADAAQVTVVAPGGAERTLSLDALAGSEDVRDRTYVLRSAAGESSVTVSGFSLAALLEAADADPFSFSYLEVQRPAGGSVQLSRHQALDPGAFAEGPPLVYATAAGTGFLRPSAGPEDLNADDSFEAPQGIRLVLRKGESLRVRAKATPLRTRTGEKVSFSATVEGAGAGEQLTFSWYFDDGSARVSGAEASHSFAKRGSYDVVVGVTTPGDPTGASAVVTIQVGAPLGGPDRKGGGTNPDADAPDHGAATGSGGAPGAGSGASAPPAPVPATPAPAAPAEPEQSKAKQPAKPAPAGDLVEGRLLSSSEPFEPEPAKQQPAARTGNLSEDGGDGPGLPGAALGLLVTAGLLGCGALIELRGLR